jgi:transcriptional regulator with XRE-family HTH domain
MTIFGEYLKKLRKDLNMTMSDVQTVAGVSQPSMSNYENGTKVPTKKTLIKLADLYEVAHEEMMQRAEEAKEMMEPTIVKPTPPQVEKKVTATGKAHKFNCLNDHTFYIPLNLPINIEEMVSILTSLQCPICHFGSKDITFNMREYTISE